MYSPLAQDQIRTSQEQIRRRVATAHQRDDLRRSTAAAESEPTGLPRLLTLAGAIRRSRSAKPAAGCRPA